MVYRHLVSTTLFRSGWVLFRRRVGAEERYREWDLVEESACMFCFVFAAALSFLLLGILGNAIADDWLV